MWRSPANACNTLAKDLSIKEMLNFRHKDSRWLTVARGYIQTFTQFLFPNPAVAFQRNKEFDECLENVLCILEEGKGFKIRFANKK